MKFFLFLSLFFVFVDYLLFLLVELVNLSGKKQNLPDSLKDFYTQEKLKKSYRYLKERTILNLIERTFLVFLIIIFLVFNIPSILDGWLNQYFNLDILKGVIFWLIIICFLEIVNLPFSFYHNFVIENKYGFNRMTYKLFFSDFFKNLFLQIIISTILLIAVLSIFKMFTAKAWILCWFFLTLFQVFLAFITPRVLIGMFYKYSPLPEGILKQKINDYFKKQNFNLQGIYTIDASQRSTKANAFFAGLGKEKRLVLFDTLINEMDPDQILGVIAHELGHYKYQHILKILLTNSIFSGIILFLFNYFLIHYNFIFFDFGLSYSVYAGILIFYLLSLPLQIVIKLFSNYIMRKYEYEADIFAVKTLQNKDFFIQALKKLHAHALAEIFPHKLKVFFDYDHPPLLERISYIENYK